MAQKSIYFTVRLDVENNSNNEITNDDVDDLFANLDYDFKSNADNLEITDFEICGLNE